MPGPCEWPVPGGGRCGKEAGYKHCLPRIGETFATATGEKVFACKDHFYRRDGVRDGRVHKFRHNEHDTECAS